jgi:hypothetical protein
MTVDYNSSGIATAFSSPDAVVINSNKVSAYGVGSGTLYYQQVQISGDAKMKLITEEIESVEVITENVNGKKTLYIQGPFLQTEVVNRNGRMYRMPVMEREVKRYTEQYVNKGRALGELGHPDGPTVNLDRVSHKIISLRERRK